MDDKKIPFEIFKFIIDKNYELINNINNKDIKDIIKTNNICYKASEKGFLDCLKYAHKNKCFWDEDTCNYAAENGHLDCLKYAHKNKCPWNYQTCQAAAINGHLDCL